MNKERLIRAVNSEPTYLIAKYRVVQLIEEATTLSAEPDKRDQEIQGLRAQVARWGIETQLIQQLLNAKTVADLDDVFSNDYETHLFTAVKESCRAAFAATKQPAVQPQLSYEEAYRIGQEHWVSSATVQAILKAAYESLTKSTITTPNE